MCETVPHSEQLSGKIAVVTGGSRGIGFAIAEALVPLGVDVVLSGRSREGLESAQSRLEQAATLKGSGRVAIAQGDLRDSLHAEQAIETAVDRFGGLDILVNNAGVGRFKNVVDQSVEEWKEVLETNLHAVFFCCQAAIPVMRGRGGGWIINISSLAGGHPFAGGAAYCASKAGLDAFTTALMQELRQHDIRVSSIAPGSVSTSFAGGTIHETAPWKLTATDVAGAVTDVLRHEKRSLPSRVEIRPSKPS